MTDVSLEAEMWENNLLNEPRHHPKPDVLSQVRQKEERGKPPKQSAESESDPFKAPAELTLAVS